MPRELCVLHAMVLGLCALHVEVMTRAASSAGLRFYSAGQPRLAVHAYRQVVGLYDQQRWRYIEEHLNDILGKQFRHQGDSWQAMRHFHRLLATCGHRPPQAQQHYMQQFQEAVQRCEPNQVRAPCT